MTIFKVTKGLTMSNPKLFRCAALKKLLGDKKKTKYMQAGMDVTTYIELKKPLPLSERFYKVEVVS